MPSRPILAGSLVLSFGLGCPEPAPRPAVGDPISASDPAPAPASPTFAAVAREDAARSAGALERGRKAFAAKDYAGAVAELEEARAIAPADPRVLTELGWAQLHAGDLEAASTTLGRAVELATDAKLAGAAWYNLGRVREATGAKDEAAQAYATSLSLRDNAIVRNRLAQLSTPAAPHRPKLDIEPLTGPFVALLSWCVEEATREGIPVEHLDCDLDVTAEDEIAVAIPALAANDGILEAKFVSRLQDGSYDGVRLALRTTAGWFIGPQIGSHGMAGVFGIHFTLAHLGIEQIDLGTGTPALLVRVDGSTLNLGVDGTTQYEDHYDDRIVCGVGESGKPSCTSPIPLVGESIAFENGDERPATSEERWAFGLKVVARAIVLTGDRAKLDEHHRAWLGKHPIAFP